MKRNQKFHGFYQDARELAFGGMLVVSVLALGYAANHLGDWLSAESIKRADRIRAFYPAEIALWRGVIQRNKSQDQTNSFAKQTETTLPDLQTAAKGTRVLPPLTSPPASTEFRLAYYTPGKFSMIRQICGQVEVSTSGAVTKVCGTLMDSGPKVRQLTNNPDPTPNSADSFLLPTELTCFYYYKQKHNDRFGIFSDTAGTSVKGHYREHSTQCDSHKSPTRSKEEEEGRLYSYFVVDGQRYHLGQAVPLPSKADAPLLGQLVLEIWEAKNPQKPKRTYVTKDRIDIRYYFDGDHEQLTDAGAIDSFHIGVKNCSTLQRFPLYHHGHFLKPDLVFNPYGAFDLWSTCQNCNCEKDENRVANKWYCHNAEVACR